MYHYYRESKYFNLDNICATAIFITYVYTWICSYHYDSITFSIGVVGLPTILYLFIACGFSAIIVFDENGKCCARKDNPTYNYIHTLWHFATGVGPIKAAIFVTNYPQAVDHGAIFNMDTIVGISLIVSIQVNFLLNYVKIAPLD